jgi:hypothetical protein
MVWIAILMMMGVSFGSGESNSKQLPKPNPYYTQIINKYDISRSLKDRKFGLGTILLQQAFFKLIYDSKYKGLFTDSRRIALIVMILSAYKAYYGEEYYGQVIELFKILYNLSGVGITSFLKNPKNSLSEHTKKILDVFYYYLQQDQLDEQFRQDMYAKFWISKRSWNNGIEPKDAAAKISAGASKIKQGFKAITSGIAGGFERAGNAMAGSSQSGAVVQGQVIGWQDDESDGDLDDDPDWQPVDSQPIMGMLVSEPSKAQPVAAQPAQSRGFV